MNGNLFIKPHGNNFITVWGKSLTSTPPIHYNVDITTTGKGGNKMGDRATFVFEQHDGNAVFLYGHWAGEGMMANLATAIEKAAVRWGDEAYATRIAISQIIGDQWNQELSWGISTYFGDSEHSVPVVNWTNQTVRLLPHSWDKKFDMNADPKFVMGFEAFINKFAKSLTNV